MLKTYNPKKITVALGNHIVTGLAEDSFVQVEQSTDGISMKIGCDGEVVRSISPDKSFSIKLGLLMYSPTNDFLTKKYRQDMEDGDGTFAVTIKDIIGETIFTTDVAWVRKLPTYGFGREASSKEWELMCGEGKISES